MTLKKLEEIINLGLGKNASRIDDKETVYGTEDFEKDLYDNENFTYTCLINLIKSQAAPLSKENMKKCITSNYLRCELNKDEIEPWYFCYEINEGTLNRQIEKYHQGNTLSVKKLNISLVSQLEIPLPKVERQKQIGRLYRLYMKRLKLMEKQQENYNIINKEILRKIEEEFVNE